MMRPLLSLLMPCLLLLGVAKGKEEPKPAPKMKEDFVQYLTPQKYETRSPLQGFENYFVSGNKAWKSEQGQDVFYEVYAELLSKRTDARFEEAEKFRKLLSKVSAGIAEFLAQANGKTVTASKTTRSRAEMEWWISQGFEKNFELWEPVDYTHDDLRQLARIYQRSHAHHVKKGRDPAGLEAKVLDPALAKLDAGEKQMSKEQILYFRAKLASMIVLSL
ncbi:hypothetical protein [Luteolibacter soli]|uniref:Uncharacterized protein n=1 Tax=Luteolibacter soli TaxID=3135280 RepID=A0ABU9ATJ9_9BACT